MRRSVQGLIVERSGRRVTALRGDGDLVTFKTNRDDIMVGMEIEVPVKMAFFTWRRLAPAVALSLVIVLVSSFGYQHYLHAQPVVAYVTLDSTGSIELEVNQAGIVKSAKALDAAGEDALSAVQYQNRPAGEVVQALIKAQDPENKSAVVVALVPVADPEPTGKEAKKTEKTMDRLERKVTESAGSSLANMTSLRLDPEIRDSAQELGISAGRAALWALTQPTTDPDPSEDPGGAQPGSEPTTDSGQTTVPGDPDDTMDPGDPVDPGVTTDPGDPGAGDPKDTHEKDILDTIKGSLPKVDPDDWREFSGRKNSKEREEQLKDITKKWLEEISKQVGKKGKDDHDDKRDDDKKDQPGNSKGDDNKKDQPGNSKGDDNEKDQPSNSKGSDGKGSQGKGNSSGSSLPGGNSGKGSSGGKQGKDDDNHDDEDDDRHRDDNRRDDDRRDDDDDSNDGKNGQSKSGSWSGKGLADFFGGWLDQLPWRRK
ncbi:MAG: hypothetical protein ACM3WU_04690 [Bacillota bacterium]